MTERVAFNSPLPCFGREQKPTNALCLKCAHKTACQDAMGSLFGRVAADKAAFNLLPDPLGQVEWSDDDFFKQLYEECYRVLFSDKFEPDSLHKVPGLREHVEAAAAKLNCPLKLFVLTVMWGHKTANPDARFYCSMLSGDAAGRRVQRYRAEVEEQYGVFTDKTLDAYAAESVGGQTYESKLLQAEIQAGSWIVGYKVKKGGPPEETFYATNEMVMPDLWLAVEPSYYAVLLAWNKDRKGTTEQNKQRMRIAKLIVQLRRRSKQAITVFKARESIMPKAIQKVLIDRGFTPDKFYLPQDKMWTSTFLFWARLGLAIQHYWCWEYLHGNRPLALKHLSAGSVY